ncbi:hypothetical protein NIES21_59560 (plasmid) [Anabaenopsis circularis NIES-21]|uniref:Uncharacterized protein n=1 Tax=Anabaenopsis circularis NIES-21 TaxID=1085406 RepID=A0A1Z4GS01_9CYAN|nr:hypothetical protein NIES21_59560 [Anabaenopsis circularis NIES-21]
MDYLSQTHQELAKYQESRLIFNFSAAVFYFKLAVVGLSLMFGASLVAVAWKGQMSSRIYFCLKTPTQELLCEDANHRPYRMSAGQWQEWGMEGRPKTVVKKNALKASNPYKPLWTGGAFLSFTIAARILRNLSSQYIEKKC